MEKQVYVTTYGRECVVEPISLLLLQKVQLTLRSGFEKDGKSLTPPKYCVELPNGDKQCFDHDEKTIVDGATSEEDRKLWEVYQGNLAEYNSKLGDRMLGVIIMDQPVDFEEGWEKNLEWLGLEIPTDELDRKMLYMTTRVLKSSDDIQGYMMKVIEISSGGVNEDAVKAARAMFRRNP